MPSDQALPDYDGLESELRALEVAGAAEAHGIIAGVLSSPRPSAEAWLGAALGDANAARDRLEAERLLEALHDYTAARLAGRESAFELLLPEEARTLEERVGALAGFCRGYLLGLVAGGVRELSALPGDAREVVEDFMKIAEAEADGRAGEVEERAFIDLLEYVRTGVQLVYEELHTAD
jgi:uncharacterized protein YgfB (UPF0149 family)